MITGDMFGNILDFPREIQLSHLWNNLVPINLYNQIQIAGNFSIRMLDFILTCEMPTQSLPLFHLRKGGLDLLGEPRTALGAEIRGERHELRTRWRAYLVPIRQH